MPSTAPLLYLILANVLIFLLDNMTNHSLMQAFALSGHPYYLPQIWRIVTYSFIHANFSHLFFNMWSVWLFGRMLIVGLGTARFLTLYFVSAALGGLLWALCNFGSPYPCVGASGASFGIMTAAAIAWPNARFMLLFPPIPLKLWVMTLGYCLLELILLYRPNDGIAHLAHLGGALGGFIFMKQLGRPGLFQHLLSLFKKKPVQGRFYGRDSHSSQEIHYTGNPSSEDVDKVLERISQVGYSDITEYEREILRRASETLRSRQDNNR